MSKQSLKTILGRAQLKNRDRYDLEKHINSAYDKVTEFIGDNPEFDSLQKVVNSLDNTNLVQIGDYNEKIIQNTIDLINKPNDDLSKTIGTVFIKNDNVLGESSKGNILKVARNPNNVKSIIVDVFSGGNYSKLEEKIITYTFTLSGNTITYTNDKITDIEGKQDKLTLTIKNNGNIVIDNIQGQSKEFMPATPSGDPMHYAYVTAGAEYNDTGADIVKTTPWADMIDDDYTGDYGKTVVHKAGYWYLNGLGDITNDEIRNIYIASSNFPAIDMKSYFGLVDFRTNFSGIRKITGWASINALGISDGSIKFSILNLSCLSGAVINLLALNNIIVHILGSEIVLSNAHNLLTAINLITAPFRSLMYDLNIGGSPVLSVKSVLYMINNEAATSPITITLHADVYNRCMANADILAALQAHTNVSLASA